MESRLLETKLYVPRSRRRLVPRDRLLQRLDPILESKLALISAPPGFGKTTLLADWTAARTDRCSVAWLSLDDGDNEPVRFWTYAIAALRGVAPGVGAEAMDMLRSMPPSSLEAVIATLINEIGAETAEIVFVLDDYHAITRLEVHRGLAFLIDNMPANLHIIVSGRADPPLPVAQLRARGDLVEIRAVDLRFLPGEAAVYFNETMQLSLSDADIRRLEERTEGWVAALQLAALSLQGRENTARFIENFAGDDRYIVDYLVQEVLERQPAAVRDFLLKTAVLDRLTGDLCDAVTGGADGAATLQLLEQRNLFVVPLDDRRAWFRYHHLFAEVLRAHLAAEGSEQTRDLHSRASRWFAEHGDPPEAIRHAFAAADFDRAAGLVEMVVQEMQRTRQDTTLRGWLEALPAAVLARRPVLSAGYAGVLLQAGEVECVGLLLDGAETAMPRAVQATTDQPIDVPVFVDGAQFADLPGMIALYRAGCAQVLGNVDDTANHARLALDRMDTDAPLRGGAMALLGLALWTRGDLEEAYETYAAGIARVHARGYVNDSSTIMLADMRVAQGRLHEALGLYERSLRAADVPGWAPQKGIADEHVGVSEILRELGDLGGAEDHLTTSRSLGEAAGLPENRYRWFTALAALRRSQAEPAEALELLDEAERLYTPGFSPDARPIAAQRARTLIAIGRLDDASDWARRRGLTPDAEPSYLREFELITFARLVLARSRVDPEGSHPVAAIRLLGDLSESAFTGGRTGSLIEVLVLECLALDVRGARVDAMRALERALELAAAEGFVRVFLDEGLQMRSLLEAMSRRRPEGYATRLLALARSSTPAPPERPASHGQLSERELEVLRLLSTDLSGPEIARELVVSLNTVRTHTKNIYTKLGVSTRRSAVRQAEELHLL